MVSVPPARARASIRTWVSLTTAIAATVALLAIAGGAVGIVQLTAAREQLADVLDPANQTAQQLSAALVDQENGIRGALLSGQRDFLTPYEEGRRAEATATAALRQLDRQWRSAGQPQSRCGRRGQPGLARPVRRANPGRNRQRRPSERPHHPGGRQGAVRPDPFHFGRSIDASGGGAYRGPRPAGSGGRHAGLDLRGDRRPSGAERYRPSGLLPPRHHPADRSAGPRRSYGRRRRLRALVPGTGPAELAQLGLDVDSMRQRHPGRTAARSRRTAPAWTSRPTSWSVQRRARAVRLCRLARPAGAAAQGGQLLPAARAALPRPARRSRPSSTSTSRSTARPGCRA